MKMHVARFTAEGNSMYLALPIRVLWAHADDRSHGWYQHGGMTTVAEAPAGSEINREGALMIAAVNGTIRPQSFPALEYLDQVAERNEVNDVSPSRQTLGDSHLPTSLQAERRCLSSWNID